jgi:hypothetical protein
LEAANDKSPFEKGGFRGIYKQLKKSPLPPFGKGGIKTEALAREAYDV